MKLTRMYTVNMVNGNWITSGITEDMDEMTRLYCKLMTWVFIDGVKMAEARKSVYEMFTMVTFTLKDGNGNPTSKYIFRIEHEHA